MLHNQTSGGRLTLVRRNLVVTAKTGRCNDPGCESVVRGLAGA